MNNWSEKGTAQDELLPIIKLKQEIISKSAHIINFEDYSPNYKNPPIPERYRHVFGTKWNTGYVIERIYDRSRFVWVPVSILHSNGTLDGYNFTEKIGRRPFREESFAPNSYCEIMDETLSAQVKSIKKYGGFYISQHKISIRKDGLLQSIPGVLPIQNVLHKDAVELAGLMEQSDSVKTHLPYGAEFDTVLEWFIESKAKTYYEVAFSSKEWGNYADSKNKYNKVVENGKNKEFYVNNIADMAGNLHEWTNEVYFNKTSPGRFFVRRGGDFYDAGYFFFPAAFRDIAKYDLLYNNTGFHVVMWLK